MILLGGIPSERPLAMLRTRLFQLSVPFIDFNQRELDAVALEYSVSDGKVTGVIKLGRCQYRLEDIQSVYSRLMNYQYLPELEDEPEDSPRRHSAAALHDAFVRWSEITPARVVNRMYPSSSNCSKIYQSHIIREAGLNVPDTLLTNDPDEARLFIDEKKDVIFKSVSGARSIVTALTADRLDALDRIVHCPTLFQERIVGTNVRVHVVGAELFATRVESSAVDYRYSAAETGRPAELSSTTLPDDTAQRCLALASRLGLPFAGIDLIVQGDGATYCLEVNPCPGYSYYELHTGQPISEALARLLSAPCD